MATQLQIVNRALTRAGALRIMDLSENTKSARAADAVYNQVRDSCLSVANWRFAMDRQTLQATTARDGFVYAYVLPASWLRYVYIRDQYVGVPSLGARYLQDMTPDFSIERDRVLLTDFAPPLKAVGVARIEDVSQYDPLFVDFFALSLTVEVWEDVSRKSSTKLEVIMRERDRALAIARTANAIQEAPQEMEDTSWVMSREGP